MMTLMQFVIPQPDVEEVKEILTGRGYYITKYNLIMKSSVSEHPIGEIRKRFWHPERVVISYSAPGKEIKNVEIEARGLLKVLKQEALLYRNMTKIQTSDKYSIPVSKHYKVVV